MSMDKQPARRTLAAITSEPWAITREGLELILAVAERENAITPEALEAYRARHVQSSERMQARGNVAVLDVRGPLFRYANIFTEVSGATSYGTLRRDLQVALDDDRFRAIVLNLDTPGGEVTGVAELADAIRAGRQRKPIIAYVGGMGASAGYWLASQATEVVTAETGILGSIGVRMTYGRMAVDRKQGTSVEFISSKSPGKRLDIDSNEGRARVQKTVDALGDVFIEAVAAGRGVSTKTVLERFGAGDVLVGTHAVRAGLADRTGSFEAVVAELARRFPTAAAKPMESTEPTLPLSQVQGLVRAALRDAQQARQAASAPVPAYADRAEPTVSDAAWAAARADAAARRAAHAAERAAMIAAGTYRTEGLVPCRPDQSAIPRADADPASAWDAVIERLKERRS